MKNENISVKTSEKNQEAMKKERAIINQVSTVGIFGNIVLTAFKLFAGIVGNSGAMVSDAVHSLSDVFATFIAFLGVKLSKKSEDKMHPRCACSNSSIFPARTASSRAARCTRPASRQAINV